MKHFIFAALILIINLWQVPCAIAQLPGKKSNLEKIFDLSWDWDRPALVAQLHKRPKIKQEKDFQGLTPLFSGGDLLGHPAACGACSFSANA